MPNRNSSESPPAYLELIAGRSPHKGFIESSEEAPAAAPAAAPIEITQLQASQAPHKQSFAFGDQVRAWTTQVFGDRRE